MKNISVQTKPMLSAIVPYYNHKKFIDKCLNSIYQQTYQNIELVVVDDCSPDGSGKYVESVVTSKKYQDRFNKNIKFTQFETNQGAHFAISYAIEQASGEFVAIINSDDVYHPERIEKIVTAMNLEQKEFAFSGVKYIDGEDKNILNSHPLAQTFAQIQQKISSYPTVGFSALISNPAISTGNFIFTKKLYQSLSGFKNYKYCHDWDFLLRVLFYTEPLFIEDELYYYRFHGNNSFESLQNVAVNETRDIIENYFSLVENKMTINPLAPSSFNWPDYFELFINLHGYSNYYKNYIYI